jgi:hypothetical protein
VELDGGELDESVENDEGLLSMRTFFLEMLPAGECRVRRRTQTEQKGQVQD